MAWSSSKQSLLVSSLANGVDVYRLVDRPHFEKRLPISVSRKNVPLQVDFAQGSNLAISGSDVGEVYVWDLASAERIQVLRHGGGFGTLSTPERWTA